MDIGHRIAIGLSIAMTDLRDQLFKSLADPTRRAIFERLCREGEQTVAALTARAGVSQPAVSKHLALLRLDRRDGRLLAGAVRPARGPAEANGSITAERSAGGRTKGTGMKIKLTTIYVDDQEKALRFYTEVLGFAKKGDVRQGPYRWLTVASPDEPEGAELQLALNDNPAGKAYQQALRQQGQPAAMFYSDDVKGECERIKARGGALSMPPTEAPWGTMAQLDDTCGNLVQITQLARG
jgi:predicted enzyme related to lactoylglutathione lyase